MSNMPLPSIAKFGAKKCQCKSKRTYLPCNNPAAYGMRTCRMHGARKRSTVLTDTDHPQYKHGQETKEAKEERKKKFAELNAIAKSLGIK